MIPALEQLATNIKNENSIISEVEIYYDYFDFKAGGIDDRVIDKIYIRFNKEEEGIYVSNGDLQDYIKYDLILVMQLNENRDIKMHEQVRRLRSQLRLNKNVKLKTFNWDSDSICKIESKAKGEEISAKKEMNLGRISFSLFVEEYPNSCQEICGDCVA